MLNDPYVQEYVDRIEAIRVAVEQFTGGLSAQQLGWQPGSGRWSVAECLSHLNASGTRLLPLISAALRQARSRGMVGHGPFSYGLLGAWFIRTQGPPVRLKMKNPRLYNPSRGQAPGRIVDEFIRLQNRLKELIVQADGLNLSRIMIPSPVSRLVRFNLATWFAATAAHEARHLGQARQVAAAEGFPGAGPRDAGTPPGISFVPLAEGEIDTVLGFMRDYYAFDHLDFQEERARTGLLESLTDAAPGSVWLIRAGEEPAGYMVLGYGYSVEFGGKIAFVDELYVTAQRRGTGIGTAALHFAEQVCRAQGIHALRLEVTSGNTMARDLYRKLKFEEHERSIMSKRI